MYVQKYFCLEETACYHAKSTEGKKKLTSDIASLHFTNILKTTPPEYMLLKCMLIFFPGIWNMKVL